MRNVLFENEISEAVFGAQLRGRLCAWTGRPMITTVVALKFEPWGGYVCGTRCNLWLLALTALTALCFFKTSA